jgi:outer membrane protein assembly factor BamB
LTRFQGIARLRAPWRPETLFRLTVADTASLELFFWRGTEGVSLRYYTNREPYVWAAYRIHRDDVASPLARRTALLTTDSGAFFRSTPGTFDLQVRDGRILLARGGIPWLTVPLGGLPEEVMLEGHLRLRGMSLHKSQPLPLPDDNAHPIVVDSRAVADGGWKPYPERASMTVARLSDQSLQFMVDPRGPPGRMWFPLPRPGLYEVIVRLDAAEPGTAISLGDAQGRPLADLAVLRDQKTQQAALGVLLPGETGETIDLDAAQQPAPYLAAGQWLRIVAGVGTLNVWLSGDALHWGHMPSNPVHNVPGGVGSIAVSGLAGRSITLGHVEIRELSGLTELVDPALKARVPDFAPEELGKAALWRHRALEAHPPGVETDRWLDACAVRTLEQGPARELGLELLQRLVAGIQQSDAEPRRIIAALHDAALLSGSWDGRAAAPYSEALQSLGLRLLRSGEQRPSHRIRTAWLNLPWWTAQSGRSELDRLMRSEMIAAVGRGDWRTAAELARESRFWNIPPLPEAPVSESAQAMDRLAGWVRAVASEQQPGLASSESVLPLAWRHPFLPDVNKDAYNLRAELDAALQGEAYDDACRLVTSLGESAFDGLLPDVVDRELFVSFPTAILTAQHEHPRFTAALNGRHAEAGLVRVKQAMAEGDVDVVRAATVQFMGTTAACEAHQWLGDRLLAAGKFFDAETHFRAALDAASPEQIVRLHSRLRLAVALTGRSLSDELPPLPPQGVELDGTTMAPSDFERLLDEVRSVRRVDEPASPSVATPIPPAGYRLEAKAQFDGHPGNNPGRPEFRFGDPFGKQLAVAADDRHVYVSNRFQMNAYDLRTGQATWAQGVGSEQGEAYDFPFHPMRPVLHGEFVFVRRLTRAGVELCCLKRAEGTVVWKQRARTHVLTDPAVWQGRLCALVGGRVEDDVLQVDFATFDMASGQVASTRPLVRFRDVWNQAIPCVWVVSERRAVCQIGPVTACLNSAGDLSWLRRRAWLPAPIDDLANDHRAAEPVIAGNRLVIYLPGSRTLDAIDIATGKLVWRTPIPEGRGLRGVAASRAVVDVGGGLTGLDIATGKITWHTPVQNLLEAMAMDDRTIVCARRGRAATPAHRPCLVWLETVSGREIAQTQIEVAEKEEWQLGPLFQAGGKTWFLGGAGWKDHRRELLELSAVTASPPAPFENATLRHWAPELTDAERSAFASVVPTWWPVAESRSRWQFAPGDVRGESRCLISRTGENQQPTWLASRLDVPAGTPSLHLRVANQPGQRWRLLVRIDEQEAAERILDDVSTNGHWQNVEVDLTPFAGRSVFAAAIHAPVDGQPSEALWKRIEVVSH